MDLLSNAVESIKAGVEDYEQGEHSRLLAAVRNIHAGILLLYKEALRRLSPVNSNEVLVKAKVVPKQTAQGVEFIGDGRKTVDIQQIKERFVGLNIATDWTRFDRITDVRNEIEHYYSKANKKALESLISDAFVVVRNFIATQLKEDPLRLLGDETWQSMLEVSEVYEAERGECELALEAFDWESPALAEGVKALSCSACGGSLLRPVTDRKHYDYDMVLQCRICGAEIPAGNFVPVAIKNALEWETYVAEKDGGDALYTVCPECGADAYIMEEERCASCGESAEHTCARCGNRIPPEELVSSPYCGWCDYMMNKDD